MQNFISILLLLFVSTVQAGGPLFTITPLVRSPEKLVQGRDGIAVYQINNNTGKDCPYPYGCGVINLPSDVTQIIDDGARTCGLRFALAPGGNCELKLKINSNQVGQIIEGGPVVCLSPEYPMFCSQPTEDDTLYSQIVAQPDATMPVLQVPLETMLLPGAAVGFPVTNTSDYTAANNVQLTLPPALQPEIASVTSSDCINISPKASCSFQITAKADAKTESFPAAATVQGSNTHSAPGLLQIAKDLKVVMPLDFQAPGTQSLQLQNDSSADITITAATVPTNIHNVTTTSTFPTCLAKSSCAIDFSATDQAYQDPSTTGSVVIDYQLGDKFYQTAAGITVANTSISVNSGSPITLSDNETKAVPVINNGTFAWHNPLYTFEPVSPNIAVITTCIGTIIPGGTCSIGITTTNADPLVSHTLTTTGTNIAPVLNTVTIQKGVTIALENTSTSKHLQYRTVKVTNNATSGSATITNIALTTSQATPELELCQPSGGQCDSEYQTNLCQEGSLAQGASCNINIHALDGSASLGPITGDSLTVTVEQTTDGKIKAGTVSKTFNIDYSRDLYAGGLFTTSGSTPITVNHIAKWNPADGWQALNDGVQSGVNGEVVSLALWKGDLAVGGGFTTAGGNTAKNIALWNGANWSELGGGVTESVTPPSRVTALGVWDDELFVGGKFDQTGTVSANNIASWDGTGWSALGTGLTLRTVDLFGFLQVEGVSSFLPDGSQLIVGGAFTSAGGVADTDNVAVWDGSAWSALGKGLLLDQTVYPTLNGGAVTKIIKWDTEIIAGGAFNQTKDSGGNPVAISSGIAQFESSTSSWINSFAGGMAWDSLPGVANALVPYGSALIAGGLFTSVNAITPVAANSIAEWTTTWINPNPFAPGILNPSSDIGVVFASALDANSSNLFVGGNFTQVGSVTTVRDIAQLNGTIWSDPFNTGTSDLIFSLLIAPSITNVTESPQP